MDSTFASAVAAAAREIGSALSVWMVAKGYDAHEPADRISFNSDGERLRADRTQIGLNVIAPLAAADSWRDLRVRIDSLKEDAITWNWIDFYLGATFTLDPSRADDVGRSAVMLGHFMPWVQKS